MSRHWATLPLLVLVVTLLLPIRQAAGGVLRWLGLARPEPDTALAAGDYEYELVTEPDGPFNMITETYNEQDYDDYEL